MRPPDAEAIGSLCTLMYGQPAWQYNPPTRIWLFVPDEVEDDRNTGWAFNPKHDFVRRYDGTAGQQAEAAVAAESAR